MCYCCLGRGPISPRSQYDQAHYANRPGAEDFRLSPHSPGSAHTTFFSPSMHDPSGLWHESGTVHSEMCCNTFITIIKEQNIGTFFSQVCFIGLQTLQLFHVVQ